MIKYLSQNPFGREKWNFRIFHTGCQWGFSLIELIVIMVVLSIIGTITIRYVVSAGQFYVTVLAQRQVDGETFLLVDRIRREVRLLQNTLVADSGEFSFLNQAGTTTSFKLNTGNVTLNGDMLATNVSAFVFSYYDGTNGALTSLPLNSSDRSLVRRVSLSLKITKGTQSSDLNTDFFYTRGGILK
jgi:Tfp pilus assembly major pilin PilA